MVTLSHIKNWAHRAIVGIDSLLKQAVRGPSEGWATFLLLLLSVMLAVWSLGSARWVPTPGLYQLAFIGVVLGLLLAKLHFKGLWLVAGGLLFGIYLSFHQLSSLVEGAAVLDRYAEVGKRLVMWGQGFAAGDVRPDAMPVTFFLLCTSWLTGFICSWSFFRKHNMWGVLLPSGIVVAVNLSALRPGAQKLQLYLYLFVICLFLARLFLLEREHDWKRRSVQRRQIDSVLTPKAFRFALATIILTSLLPAPRLQVAPVVEIWDRISASVTGIWQELGGAAQNTPDEDPISQHPFGYTSPFRGSTFLREEPVLLVEAPFPVYLRARSYDVYTHSGWETGHTERLPPESIDREGLEQKFQKQRRVEITVKMLQTLAAGEPVYLGGYPVDMSIGYELEVGVWSAPQEPGMEGAEENIAVHSLVAADIADIICVRTSVAISAGQSYQTTVLLSAATDSDLLAGGTDYPGWVLDRYLQLPDTMPSRVLDLAQELTKGLDSPYEKAVAVCDYLRTLEYTVNIQAPPAATDGVDYFLFEARKGYCQYFASAMTVLLRASGVPSRMVVGYGPGEPALEYGREDVAGQPPYRWDDSQQTFIVRNSHAWSEVFFPEYGWVPFEPTPAYPPITREEFVFPPAGGDGTGDSGETPADGETDAPWSVRTLAVFLGLALAATAIWMGWRRLLGRVLDPRVAYARMGHLATLSGMGPRETLTPQEYGLKLAAAVPQMTPALNQIVDTYMRVTYSQHSFNSQDKSIMAQAWPQVRKHLLLHALRRVLPAKLRGKTRILNGLQQKG